MTHNYFISALVPGLLFTQDGLVLFFSTLSEVRESGIHPRNLPEKTQSCEIE